MIPKEGIIKLLKANYLISVAIALMLIGYGISGGTYNSVTAIFCVLGVIFLFTSAFVGIGAFITIKEADK